MQARSCAGDLALPSTGSPQMPTGVANERLSAALDA